MLNILNLIIGLAFLILISIIDVKTYDKKKGYIPSMLTTLFLITSFIVAGPSCIPSGILAGLIALLLTDLDFWGGIADFKVFVASGMLFSLMGMLYFAGAVTIIGFAYKVVFLRILKNQKAQIPFIPVMLLSFIIIQLLI